MIVIGSVIGSGIFKNPSSMASLVRSPELLMLIWLGAGLVTMFGALTNAEVSGVIPSTGGQYEYFRVMYGDFTAFMYGWALFFVIQTGSIASITYVFAYYFDSLFPLFSLPEEAWRSLAVPLPFGTIFPLQELGIKLLTVSAIALLTVINFFGVREGGIIQSVFTVAKICAILVLVGAAFMFGDGNTVNLFEASKQGVPVGMALMGAIVLTMNKALWAYDGWNSITYVAGEITEPQRNIPKALMIGSVTIIVVYALINLAYLYILPIDALMNSESVAADVAQIVMGKWGLTFVAIAVMISTIGTSNGTILASARVFYAMAKDGYFFKRVNYVHPRFHTPSRALVWQCVWTCVLVFSGTFDMLTEMLIFVSWAFYGLGAYGVFVLRRKMPSAERPYRVWGYPTVPIIFIVFAVAFLVFSIVADVQQYIAGHARGEDPIINSLYGIVLLAIGIPFYARFRTSIQR